MHHLTVMGVSAACVGGNMPWEQQQEIYDSIYHNSNSVKVGHACEMRRAHWLKTSGIYWDRRAGWYCEPACCTALQVPAFMIGSCAQAQLLHRCNPWPSSPQFLPATVAARRG